MGAESHAWIGYCLNMDDHKSFFEREDGKTLIEIAARVLGTSEEEDFDEFYTKKGRFAEAVRLFLMHWLYDDGLKPKFVWVGDPYSGNDMYCGITLKGLTDSDSENFFEFSRQQRDQLALFSLRLRRIGFKLGEMKIHNKILVY
jgi:hypothetical protein